MTDLCERGTQREEEVRNDALIAQKRRAGLAGKTSADSATHCRVCEDPISQKRRESYPGVQTCVDCQADLELELKKKGWSA